MVVERARGRRTSSWSSTNSSRRRSRRSSRAARRGRRYRRRGRRRNRRRGRRRNRRRGRRRRVSHGEDHLAALVDHRVGAGALLEDLPCRDGRRSSDARLSRPRPTALSAACASARLIDVTSGTFTCTGAGLLLTYTMTVEFGGTSWPCFGSWSTTVPAGWVEFSCLTSGTRFIPCKVATAWSWGMPTSDGTATRLLADAIVKVMVSPALTGA